MNTEPTIDVVVVAYGSEELIEGCLGSLAAAPEVSSIVVVDNGDGLSADAAEALGATVVRRPDNPGFGAGQNQGVALTAAPFVLLLNPDAEMEPDALRAGLVALEDRAVGAVQGVVAAESTGEPERSAGRELGPLHLLGRAFAARRLLRSRVIAGMAKQVPALRDHVERAPSQAEEVETLAAVSILVRRRAFLDVEGFDEGYFLYGEDLDFCRRLRAAGWRLLALPAPWSRHHSGASAEGWWDRELRWWEGTMQFAAQWWRTPSFAVGLLAAVVMWARLTINRPRSAGRAARSLLARPMSLRRRQSQVR